VCCCWVSYTENDISVSFYPVSIKHFLKTKKENFLFYVCVFVYIYIYIYILTNELTLIPYHEILLKLVIDLLARWLIPDFPFRLSLIWIRGEFNISYIYWKKFIWYLLAYNYKLYVFIRFPIFSLVKTCHCKSTEEMLK